MKHRLLPHTVFLVLLLGGYAALWAASLPRQGRLSNYFHFWSRSALVWAQNTGRTWLSDRAQNVSEIFEVDIASGKEVRTVFMRPIRHWSRGFQIESTPDGKYLFGLVGEDDSIGLIDPVRGRVVQTLQYGDWDGPEISRWRQLAGFDERGTNAFIVAADEPAKETVLMEWDLESGRDRVLLQSDASWTTVGAGKRYLSVGRYMRVPGRRPHQFLQLPGHPSSFSQMFTDSQIALYGLDESKEPRWRSGFPTIGLGLPAFTGGGDAAILDRTGRELSLVSLKTGHEYLRFSTPEWYYNAGMRGPLGIGGERIAVVTQHLPLPYRTDAALESGREGSSILILDVGRKKWIGRYSIVESVGSCVIDDFRVSQDGQWLAGIAFLGNRKGGLKWQLLVYDLGSLPHKWNLEACTSTQPAKTRRRRK